MTPPRHALLASIWLAGCVDGGAPGGTVEIDLAGLDPAALRIDGARPPAAALGTVILRPRRGATVRLSHPDACPVDPVRADGAPARVRLVPRLEIVAPEGPVGFDTAFTVEARLPCDAGAGRPVWRQIGGSPILEAAQDGGALHARTASLAALRPGALPWGLVPLSPATRGESVLEVEGRAAGGHVLRRQVTVAAAARATGVPSLPAGIAYLLGPSPEAGWRATSGPPGFEGAIAIRGGVTTFLPPRPGRYQLVDGGGRRLDVRVNRHDETPLDCGRADCHPRATEAARRSRMTTVFHRGVEGLLAPDYDPRCAVACHAAGEPGVDDGGWIDVAAALGVVLPARGARGLWDALPQPLRRLGSVGCTTCHGPAAIPEESARWSILRADVCAVCHDAPPRYPKVAAWRRTRMARADASPGTTAEGCRDCHTTGGFLAAAGARKLDAAPPDGVGPLGIACAACHAPHGPRPGAKLLREVPPPPGLGADLPPAAIASAVCLPCHAPDGDLEAPVSASAAAIWLGRGGVGARGAPLLGPAPHATLACTACHDGIAHDFRARCQGCHDAAPRVDATLAPRAAALWQRLGGGPHGRADRPRGRAARDVSLVVEDPAAWAHNPAYARALLDEAGRMLGGVLP